MTDVVLRDLTVRRGGCPVVDGVSVTLTPGGLACLVGPNGAGKTTLMRAAQGLLAHEGRTTLGSLPLRDRARRVAWIPQGRHVAWPISVAECVGLGRAPWRSWQGGVSAADAGAVDRALARLGIGHMRDRDAAALSGGEQALVLIARALAQDTPVLFADEPIAGLDPAHQLSVMEIFADLAREGRTVLLSIHDLGLAARFAGRLLVLDGGRLVADGAPGEVLRLDLLRDVFRLRARFVDGPDGPLFHPLAAITGTTDAD